MNELIPIEDMNYLAQQSQGKINMILSGMTALMNDTEDKTEKMEKQNWFQRMVKTVTGKNRATREEIKQNHDKLNAYMSQAIAELYNRNCIDSQVMISLGTQLNELYAEHLQLKQMLGAFVVKLNEKIDSVDNFHMLNTEIEQGVYSDNEKIIAICKVMSQFDNRIMGEPRKLDILRRSMEKQEIITEDEVLLIDYLMDIMNISVDEIGKIYLELSTIRNDFFANLILGVIEDYHFLPDMQRKMMKKEKIIGNLIQREGLDDTITLSINEVYDNFINSKIEVKEGLIPIESIQNQRGNQISYNNNDNLEMKRAEQLFLNCKFEEAFELFKRLAENGSGRAMYFLGQFYMVPYGKIRRDRERSKKWRKKGKETGDILSTLRTGYLLPKDSAERNNTFHTIFGDILKLSEEGDIFAQFELGYMYLNGNGVKEDKEEGIRWLKKSAEEGYWYSMNWLGDIYESQRKYDEAAKWYKRSFEKGYDLGGLELGKYYHNGSGVQQDDFKAIELFKKVYNLGHFASGQAANGIGLLCRNQSEKIEWYKKSFEKDCGWGGLSLSECYRDGINGVQQDYATAVKILKESYKLEDSPSGYIANSLGDLYYEGKIDHMPDFFVHHPKFEEAVEWYKKAVEKGNARAYYSLANCYYKGQGVKIDKNKAYELYKTAAEFGIEEAKTIVNNW